MVLVQTLGVTSLLYIAIGYWSGRLRELRDPAHGLVPLALGAAATAFAGLGMAVIQFLLGVDAPVSLLLLQQLFITVLVNTLIALPGLCARAPGDPPRAARGSPPQAPPRVHDRRAQPPPATLRPARPDPPLVEMIQLPEDRRPPLTPQLALRVAVIGSFALAMFAIIFFRLWFLQVLSGDQYRQLASGNQVRRISVPAQRGEIVDRNGNILVDSRPSIAVQISPPDLPTTNVGRRHLYHRLASVLRMSAKRTNCLVDGHGVERLAPIPCTVAQQVGPAPVRQRDGQDRRQQGHPLLPLRASDPVPGGHRPAGVAAVLSVQRPRGSAVRDRRTDQLRIEDVL